MHAVVLQLRRAVKKAKQFELRKLLRRVKEAEEAKRPGLQEQLRVAKAASVEQLAGVAQAKLGLGTPAGDGGRWEAGPQTAVYDRILGANCVRQVVESVHARTQAAAAEDVDEGQGGPSGIAGGADEATASDGSGSESEPASDEIDEEAEAALAKLLASTSSRGGASSDDDVAIDEADLADMSGLESGDDSDPQASAGDDDSDPQPEPAARGLEQQVPRPGKPGKARAAASKPSREPPPKKVKKKNRMGQRERQRLAALEHGRPPPPITKRSSKPAGGGGPGKDLTSGEALHPSWVAKKQQAAIKIPDPNAAAPPSSKIVFDDED